MTDRPALQENLTRLLDRASRDGRKALVSRWGIEAVLAALAANAELRPEQLPPEGDWAIWVILAGRGFGKTRTGAEWLHALALERPRRFALVGPSLDNARAVMVEGESGLIARVPQGGDVSFTASQRQLNWSNGSLARLYSGGEPDSLRGGQFDFAWGDEFAHWPEAEATLTNLRLATRLGPQPRLLLTTTPLPHQWLKDLIAEPGVVVTRGRMADNEANLPPGFIAALQRRYGDTAIGRQEMDGEIIADVAGALWTRTLIERQRAPAPAQMVRIVVGVDPPAGAAEGVCGIIVAGLDAAGRGHVLADASVTGERPEAWARAVVAAADRWRADRVIAEINNGGDMVTALLRSIDAALPLTPVLSAARRRDW